MLDFFESIFPGLGSSGIKILITLFVILAVSGFFRQEKKEKDN